MRNYEIVDRCFFPLMMSY